MKLFGLHRYAALSILNAVLFGGGIYRAMQTYKRDNPDFRYQDLWQVGFMSGIIATILFTFFMALYLYHIDTEFAGNMLNGWDINYNTGVLIMLFSMVLMGFSTSIICCLTFMQRFKKSWNPSFKTLDQ